MDRTLKGTFPLPWYPHHQYVPYCCSSGMIEREVSILPMSRTITSLKRLYHKISAEVKPADASAVIVQVAGEVQGSEDSIKSYLKELNKGPRAAHVVKVEKEEMSVKEGESSFGIQ